MHACHTQEVTVAAQMQSNALVNADTTEVVNITSTELMNKF